jgi:hypothetical protein
VRSGANWDPKHRHKVRAAKSTGRFDRQNWTQKGGDGEDDDEAVNDEDEEVVGDEEKVDGDASMPAADL